MKHLRILGLAAAIAAIAACGASSGAPRSDDPVVHGEQNAELTDAQLRKLDPRLLERLQRDGDDSLPVKVRFARTPSDADLADLLLTRVGGLVVGNVTPTKLKQLAAREDVEEISYFSGAGYDDGDDPS